MKIQDRVKSFRRVKARDLLPDPENPRLHGKDQRNSMTTLLETVGIAGTLAAREENGKLYLVDGHLRQDLDPGQKWPVAILDVTASEARTLMAAMDPIGAMAKTDDAKLNSIVDGLKQDTADDSELQGLLDGLKQELTEELTEEPEQEEQPEAEPRVERRDLWYLGEHRLICGDATEPEDWNSLMIGKTADLIYADPPYGVSYNSDVFGGIGPEDEKRDDDLLANLLVPSFKAMARHAKDTAAFYIWHSAWARQDFVDAMQAAGIIERQCLIWVKNHYSLGRSDYHWQHEPCFYAHKDGGEPAFYGARTKTTVWRAATREAGKVSISIERGVQILDGQGGSLYIQEAPPKGKKIRKIRIKAGETICLNQTNSGSDIWEVDRTANAEFTHPTQKPLDLCLRMIRNSTREGEIVVDPFSGSGTMTIAAQRTGRICYAMELAPQYCDQILARWETETGSTAVKAGDQE